MALCVLDDVRTFLKTPDKETGNDNLISALIPAAQSFIEEYCNRKFEQAGYVEYYHGGVNRIGVKNPPISQDPKNAPVIFEDNDRNYTDDTKVEITDYYIDWDLGEIFFDYELERGWGAVKVSYTGGFDTVPGAVRQACVELIARKVKVGVTGDIGVRSRTHAGINTSFDPSDLLPETKIALDVYRLPTSQ